MKKGVDFAMNISGVAVSAACMCMHVVGPEGVRLKLSLTRVHITVGS